MFGDVLAHSGCIRNHRSYCGMSYECIWVDLELIPCQDPISVIGPIEAAVAGPLNVAERPKQSTKGKGKATEDESAPARVDEDGIMGLSDEQWGVCQRFLVDQVLRKWLEIEALFCEVATLEGMMGEM
jgi:hypothetical protein